MSSSRPHDPPPPPPEGYDPISDEPLSPMAEAFGMRLTVWEEDFAVVECRVGPAIINRQGLVHGGALMTLLDTAMGYCGVYCPYPGRRRNALTLSMTTQFLASTSDGLVRTEGRRVGGGRSIYYGEAVSFDESGRRLATASAVFKLRSDSATLYGAPREGAD